MTILLMYRYSSLLLRCAGDVLEQAVFLSIQMQDDRAFERNYDQLKTYYTDTGYATSLFGTGKTFPKLRMTVSLLSILRLWLECRLVLPQSPQANTIIGLDLLRLLVENRIAEFHTELELLSLEVSMHTS